REPVEAFLQERERREDAAALQALDDFLIEERVDFAQRFARTFAVVRTDDGETGSSQGPEALEPVVLRAGSGRGTEQDRREEEHEPPAPTIHRPMLHTERPKSANTLIDAPRRLTEMFGPSSPRPRRCPS